ncbi:MAG: hypothetical protein K2H94_09710 [Duncaniella sp.]|nr:hypothetical protein [Duncaniella sp.]
MIRLLTAIALIFATSLAALADKPTQAEREAWEKEMQQYKAEYMTRALGLTAEQKTKLIPLVNRMDQETKRLMDQTSALKKSVEKKGDAATELELEKAAEAQFEYKAKEARIEQKYYKEFKKILTPRQLLKFKDAERGFMRDLMKKYRQSKGNKNHKNSKDARPSKENSGAGKDKSRK